MKNIRNTIILGMLIISSSVFSQVIIGDAVGTAPTNKKTSVLLEFANTNNRGIILPYVTTLPTVAPIRVEGTILLDAVNQSAARVKFYNANTTAGTNGWFDLSGQDGNVTSSFTNNQQPTGIDESGSKSIIGANSSSADGVLVLESTTKAMVLPVVSSTDMVLSPSPGMMVYINKQGAKRLAVFNGSKWSYWKP